MDCGKVSEKMNVERYQNDLDELVQKGHKLYDAMRFECQPEEFKSTIASRLGDESDDYVNSLPSVNNEYQIWYSEAKALVRQLIPDRLADFVRHYEQPKSRKEVTETNYTIEDYLQGTTVRQKIKPEASQLVRGILDEMPLPGEPSAIIGRDAAIPHLQQQVSIVRSIQKRFESSLFDIRQLAQADLFDSELDAAKELAKNKFNRAAGALAGVVLERHLKEVCENHGLVIRKKAPHISDLNDALKGENVIDTPQWRSIQHLGDLRNLCSHHKDAEPKAHQIEDLLTGVSKVTKTVF